MIQERAQNEEMKWREMYLNNSPNPGNGKVQGKVGDRVSLSYTNPNAVLGRNLPSNDNAPNLRSKNTEK